MDIIVKQNNDVTIERTLKDDTGTLVNLTGATCTLRVRGGLSLDIDGTVTSAAGGVVEFEVTNLQLDVDSGRYAYEILLTTADSKKYSVETGELVVEASLFA